MNVTFTIDPDGKQIIYSNVPGTCPRCEGHVFQGDQIRIDANGDRHCGAKWVCDARRAGAPQEGPAGRVPTS